ncbi:MAG: DUF3482 domain-containing protein [candidate division KSB1 bacterium]|nr:DUF3482 domain-containing protein [candidate division KSB1 bacterium]MDZ7273936.1 DUF3482 domain-containing protein [candidate division KSB1 bacterium]MDZ7286092.1 DUF3482 domain-containing protein [candidate division KSB1 bacterium]MDZ7299124.1 DUF3482 domain-containing protein [candidate division KSB1 bacterium]MDZ7306671.1 DUF3482 domain-containing protein [candidate division KSB1 bacterium]
MRSLSKKIADSRNLLPHSLGTSVLLLLAIYLLAHFITYNLFAEEMVVAEKFEIREIEKLELPPPKKLVPQPQKFVSRPVSAPPPAPVAPPQPQPRDNPSAETKTPQIDVANLVASLNSRSLLSPQVTAARSRPGERNNVSQVKIQTEAAALQFDPAAALAAAVAAGTGRSRVGSPGNMRGAGPGAGVDLGEGSGAGVDAGDAGLSFGTGTAGRRSGKGAGNGLGNGTGIGVGAGSGFGVGAGGGEAGLDIHELIKWMKAHPGVIPRLVQYDMNHQPGDLASAVTFTSNGRRFQMYLSCNENDLLLRICLIEADKFIMLKDNGIKEKSNFLSTGGVVYQGGAIQSLISARQAPGDLAQQFYRIFWSWWETERVKK